MQNSDNHFGIISLNYDMIIEKIVDEINSKLNPAKKLQIAGSINNTSDCYCSEYSISMAKLHGTLSPLNIIPPTWNKVRRQGIEHTWRLASQLISKANQIIFVGYSLSPSDNYMKYLLITGILGSLNLEGIQVICLDGGGVGQRYGALFNYKMRFHGIDIGNYLQNIVAPAGLTSGDEYCPIKDAMTKMNNYLA